MSYYSRMASAIQNDVYSGLKGFHHNLSMSMELVEDEIVQERLLIIKEYILKDAIAKKDLLLSLNCVKVDCKDLEKCSKCLGATIDGTPTAHFEIPLVITDFDGFGIEFIGTPDRTEIFTVYTSMILATKHKYRKRRKDKPYVYVDTTPNEHNMYDCYIFNAPFIKMVSVVAIFKDLRLVESTDCCLNLDEHFTWIDNEVLRRLTEKKLRYYRLFSPPTLPNDQSYRL